MLSEHLKTILNQRGMTMEELSSLSGVPLETIRNLVYHKAENPRLKTILALCGALNVSVESMMSDHPQESENQLLAHYHQCSPHGKYLVGLIASLEAELTTAAENDPSKHLIPCFLPPNTMTDGSPYTTCGVTRINTACREAFLAVQAPNNNYAPMYCRGDILLFTNRFPQDGEHALFLYDRHIYFRRFHNTYENDYILSAICQRGSALRLKRMDSCRLIGTCLGVSRANFML